MNIERLKEIENFNLKTGSHNSLQDGACVMELVSYIAGEPWSDHPECACPVLTSYAQRTNDRVDDVTRQRLKAIIPKLLNSRGTKADEKARGEFLAHHVVTVILPLLTEALDLKEVTEKLRSFKIGEWIEMRNYCRDQKATIRKAAADAAYAAYAADAAYAAYAAADAAYAADAYDAAAYAADAADSAAYAADAAKWKCVRQAIWDARIEALAKACEIKRCDK